MRNARNISLTVKRVEGGVAALRSLSDQNVLAQYRLVHFAPHGALAGEITGVTEPGLIMSPPETATERDDGYLSAAEIAGLKLDADWVILSACNTAAGGADNAEALSGLARAFFRDRPETPSVFLPTIRCVTPMVVSCGGAALALHVDRVVHDQ